MKINLSREAMESLPEPDSEGVIRVNAALSMTTDGDVDLMEINDFPVGGPKDTDDDNPMPEIPEIPAM